MSFVMTTLPVVLVRANERYSGEHRTLETNIFGAFPPLGIAQIAAVVRQTGRSVRLVDGTIENTTPESMAERVGAGFEGVVGFSSGTLNWRSTYRAIQALKRIAPKATVVVGGPQMDVYPDEVVSFPEVDYGIVGEGEYALPLLLEALEAGHDGLDAPGVTAFRDGRAVKAAPAPPIKDLGALPHSALDLLPISRYRALTIPSPFTTLITSRGCPFHCRFCSQQYAGGKFRQRPVHDVAEEIAWHVRAFRAREILFFDETFTIGARRVIELCEAIGDLGVKVGFNIRARADTVTRPMARALAAAGCTGVNVGIEAGTDRILEKMNKSVTVEEMRRGIEICHSEGLTTRGYFMLGYEGETAAEMEDTIRFACDLPLDFASFTITQLNPATADYETALFNGHTYDYWRDYTLMKDVPATPPRPPNPDYSEEFLNGVLRSAYRRFYMRPGLAARHARSARMRRWAADAVFNQVSFTRAFAELMRPAYLSTGYSGAG